MSYLTSICSTHAASGYAVQGQGAPIVLLHNSMSSKAQWSALADRLCGRYRVIAIDLFGYGDVPQPDEGTDYRLWTEVVRIKAVLQRVLGPGERFHLAGHGFGGAVALRLAHAERSRVMSVALYEPTAFHLLPYTSPALAEVRQISERIKFALGDDAHTAGARSFIDFWSGEGSYNAFSFGRQMHFGTQLAMVDRNLDALLEDTHSAYDYAYIPCPILVMLGNHSRPCTAAVAAELSRHHPSCLLLEMEGGHMAPMTHRDSVNGEIDAFIAMVDADAIRARA
jgi:pimeloyl-ACP methyl ester carboxylesterase